ncbi:MAG: M28 family peptidase [Patescibacteria group bacterium]
MDEQYLNKIITDLCDLGERQGKTETEARRYIETELNNNNISFMAEEFLVDLPEIKKCFLTADDKEIPTLACGLVGGQVTDNHHLISSLTSSQDFLYTTNINFNPVCSVISKANYYLAPAWAINREDVPILIKAENIYGELEVVRYTHTSANILVGNIKNPQAIIFSHHDSVETGAIDNASGTALALTLIKDNIVDLENVLFVFSGNEEVSYEEPIYWGAGYRQFEARHKDLLEQAEHLLILDSLGHSLTEIIIKPEILPLGFPLKNLNKWQNKTKILAGDLDQLMPVYHSRADKPEGINSQELTKAGRLVADLLK